LWNKFGPYSCTLNIDEVEDIEKTWAELAVKINEPVDKVKQGIQLVKDMFIVLDHTRTILITISDGSLPSNVGGGGNVRNILRRVLFILKKNGWLEKLGLEGFLEIFEAHKTDLMGIYGKFKEYKSFGEIIKVEYERWLHTDDVQALNLEKLIKKKGGKLSMDDWIMCMQSWGIAADKISEICKAPIPGNLYYEIATRQERVGKAAETILYSTIHLPETVNLYYADSHALSFSAECLTVFNNVLMKNRRNLVILN
jgi:alanyl-tRNA synthetase